MSINFFNKFFKENDKIFLETIQGFGLDVKNVVMDNTIQWCETTKPSKCKGFYILVKDKNDKLHGMYGTYAKKDQHEWHQDDGEPRDEEVEKIFSAVKSRVKKKRIKARINEIMHQAKPLSSDDGHPYLHSKHICYPNGSVYKGKLVIPLANTKNEVTAIQLIDKNGKRIIVNHDGVQGSCLCIDKKAHTHVNQPETVYVCAGFQTAATLWKATKFPVLCALYLKNLKPVLLRAQNQYPKSRLVLAVPARGDHEANTSLDEARRAARKIKAKVVEPVVITAGKKGWTTFNHVLITQGLDGVKQQLKGSAKSSSNDSSDARSGRADAASEAYTDNSGETDEKQVKEASSLSGPVEISGKNHPERQGDEPEQGAAGAKGSLAADRSEETSETFDVPSISANTGQASNIAQPAWPEPDPVMFDGFVGEFVSAAVEKSEADPVGVLVTFLSRFGVEIGPDVYKVHPENQPGKINAVLVGASGMARKGTSASPVRALFDFDASSSWQGAETKNGPLSSGEGIIEAVKDAETVWRKNQETGEEELVVKDPGVKDKRLMVIEGEFANPLDSMRRQGNTLSNIIRCMYDGHKLAPMTKTNKISATGHHVAIVAHISRDELMKKLSLTECYNGFVNRFLWVCVRRGELCPFPQIMNPDVLGDFQKRLLEILKWSEKHRGEFDFSEDAAKLWEKKYSEITDLDEGVMSQILSRGATHTIRLSLIYAVLDCSKKIHKRHLERALAVWEYATDSAYTIFGELEESNYSRIIIAALRDEPEGLTSTQLHKLFGNHVKNRVLRKELDSLVETGRIRLEKRKTKGAPKKVYLLAKDSEIC